MGGRQLRRRGCDLRELRPDRQARAGPRASCPTCATWSASSDDGDHPGGAARARPGRRCGRARPPRRGPPSSTTPASSSTPPGPPARRRAASSPTSTAPRSGPMIHELGVHRRRRGLLPLPAAGPRLRPDRAGGLIRGRRRRSSTSAATPRRSSPSSTETHPTYFPSVPRIFEKLYTLVTSQAEPGQIEGAVKLGLRVRELEEAGEEVPEDLRAAYEQADEALFSRCGRSSAARSAVRSAAPRRSPPRSSASSSPPACRCWRATG